jgi:hypothetical protein
MYWKRCGGSSPFDGTRNNSLLSVRACEAARAYTGSSDEKKFGGGHSSRSPEHMLAQMLEDRQAHARARFVVFSGHVLNYERHEHGGVTYFVTGGGGAHAYPIERTPERSLPEQGNQLSLPSGRGGQAAIECHDESPANGLRKTVVDDARPIRDRCSEERSGRRAINFSVPVIKFDARLVEVDLPPDFVLICDYTGKEVVE